VAGGLGGAIQTDRHVRYPTGVPYEEMKTFGDFFINLLELFDVHTNSFGNDGKEALAWHA
jgi:hypothetical protein